MTMTAKMYDDMCGLWTMDWDDVRNNDVVKRHIELNGNTANSLHKVAIEGSHDHVL